MALRKGFTKIYGKEYAKKIGEQAFYTDYKQSSPTRTSSGWKWS